MECGLIGGAHLEEMLSQRCDLVHGAVQREDVRATLHHQLTSLLTGGSRVCNDGTYFHLVLLLQPPHHLAKLGAEKLIILSATCHVHDCEPIHLQHTRHRTSDG